MGLYVTVVCDVGIAGLVGVYCLNFT